MTTVSWCRACGMETTGTGGRCPACGAETTVSPMPALIQTDEPEVAFELVDWSPLERADLVAWLLASRIRHRMEDGSVVVGAEDEARTDAIIDWVTSPDRQTEDAISAQEWSDALVALRRACRAIERDPGLVVSPDLVGNVTSVLELGVPEGWPVEAWYEVRIVADRLVNEAADAADAALIHWARRMAWLIRVYSGGDGVSAPPRALPPLPAPPAWVPLAPGLSWCRECLYEDVTESLACPQCGAELIVTAVPRLQGADREDNTVQEVEYRLDGWGPDESRHLMTLLFDYRVAHLFEDGGLIVGGADEELVDALTHEAATGARMSGTVAIGHADPEAAEPLSQLLDAAKVVVRTPSAVDDRDFVDAALAVLTMPAPFGIDRQLWDRAGELTHELLHGPAGQEQAAVANRAASLARLIAPWLSADKPPAAADPATARDPTTAGDADELVYELPGWSEEQRRQLALVLEREGITHSWEGEGDLIVDAGAERHVEAVLDEVETADDPPMTVGGGQEVDGYHAISDLFGACDRLFHRPADKDIRRETTDDVAQVMGLAAPYGVAASDWWEITSRAAVLSEAVESDADDAVIADDAATLRELLRAFL